MWVWVSERWPILQQPPGYSFHWPNSLGLSQNWSVALCERAATRAEYWRLGKLQSIVIRSLNSHSCLWLPLCSALCLPSESCWHPKWRLQRSQRWSTWPVSSMMMSLMEPVCDEASLVCSLLGGNARSVKMFTYCAYIAAYIPAFIMGIQCW